MKVFSTVVKLLVALAAIAGAVYVAATYGDKIVAWCKKLLNSCSCCCDCECDGECKCDCECECADEEVEVEVVPAEEVVAAEAAPVAEEADFEG